MQFSNSINKKENSKDQESNRKKGNVIRSPNTEISFYPIPRNNEIIYLTAIQPIHRRNQTVAQA